jgi:hypothetical protein
LTSDSKLYDEKALLKDLKDKMFWNLQRTLIFDIYKTIDLYEFARLCQFIDQTLRDVNIKFRNIREEYEESTLKENFNNQVSSREQSNEFKLRSETFKLNANNQSSNNREMSQVFAFDQINAFICYNCDKSDHIARRCSALRKMNLNSFVREIEKNISDQDNESRKE